MKRLISQALAAFFLVLSMATSVAAQQSPLVFATIERPPFSYTENGKFTGFSIDLMRAVAEDLERKIEFRSTETFPEMLGGVESGAFDGAIANISITAEREATMDFSLPIYKSGLQIMVPQDKAGGSLFRAVFSMELLVLCLAAFAILFAAGMLMWIFERRKQPYFDRPMDEAMFPAFWWALNLVVNGGFEERMPRSVPGRILSVTMVLTSLFLLSVFVAQITSSLTVEAISGSIKGINDLDGRRVATTESSTASTYLDTRDIGHETFPTLTALFEAFDQGKLDAVFFDGPILAHYVSTKGRDKAKLIERVFRPEDYGIALAAQSTLRESINRSLLGLRENGNFRKIEERWFGQSR